MKAQREQDQLIRDRNRRAEELKKTKAAAREQKGTLHKEPPPKGFIGFIGAPRASQGERPPTQVASLTKGVDLGTPTTYQQAITGSDATQWKKAIQEEYNSHQKCGTWELVERPPSGTNIVGSKWCFKLKRNTDGTIARYKARLVAQGFSQKHGVDYFETFSPTSDFTALRCLLTVAASKDWEIGQADIGTAYLNGDVDTTIYMCQPQGYTQGDKVCLLKKSIYGLKQSRKR